MADLKLWDLLYLANKYLVKQLQKMVEERIVNCLETCQHKPDLLNHWQRSRENILGDQFITLLKAEIEVFAEAVFSSEEFFSISREEAKEILKFEDLRLTEGQIFQSAAGWCLRNNQSEREAEVEFQRVFQNVIHYEVLTSADFIQNRLPNSNILERGVKENNLT